jgi:hypothetical protein
MSLQELEQGLLRALAFHVALGYAPTEVELIASWDRGLSLDIFSPSWKEVKSVLYDLVKEKRVIVMRGRCVFPGQESLVFEHARQTDTVSSRFRASRPVPLETCESPRCGRFCCATPLPLSPRALMIVWVDVVADRLA